jgi:hypothetical protein
MAGVGDAAVRDLAARDSALIRVDAVWLAVEPLDMPSGTESALARVVRVFGGAHPHTVHLFANRRANRMRVLVTTVWASGSQPGAHPLRRKRRGAQTGLLHAHNVE